VIFHMTTSQLIRSVASLSKAKAVPNLAAHLSTENDDGWQKMDQRESVESRKCLLNSGGTLNQAACNTRNIHPP
jgi:hypothetical protein